MIQTDGYVSYAAFPSSLSYKNCVYTARIRETVFLVATTMTFLPVHSKKSNPTIPVLTVSEFVQKIGSHTLVKTYSTLTGPKYRKFSIALWVFSYRLQALGVGEDGPQNKYQLPQGWWEKHWKYVRWFRFVARNGGTFTKSVMPTSP